jgi:3-deoxy-manno-octulosonate cytidylyltransferase (CMP-KDO synthetase)
MVQHVYERCVASGAFSRVLIATDDARISMAVHGFGGEAVMTSESCFTGTDRVAEVARELPQEELFVNVQGDEPLVPKEALVTLASAFEDPAVEMATLCRPLQELERATQNVVKVVLARNGDALYFSRADIPASRDPSDPAVRMANRWGHIGLYGYRRHVLLKLAGLPPSPLEQTEKLEQLRALEHGIPIRCLRSLASPIAVDTPEDLERAERLLLDSHTP